MAKGYRIISADTHLQIAAERWTQHIPAKYRDQAPRTIRLPNGGDATVFKDGKIHPSHGLMAGMPFENRWPVGSQFDTSPGCGSPEQRLREQDRDGVDGEIMFTYPTGVSFYRGIKDRSAYKAAIHAWNVFLAEEYCVVAPQRLIAMGMLPDTGVQDAIEEMEYCARNGLKGVYLSNYPSGEDDPTLEDDRFWAAALDLDMPLTGHVVFSSAGSHRRFTYQYQDDPKEVAGGVDPFSKFSQYALRGAGNALQMVFTGVFDRFPRLRIYFAETQVGWIPHFLDTLEDQYVRHMPWAARMGLMKKLQRPPGEYIREHFSWGFMCNPFGVRVRHEIGVTRMMWGSDFPHAESNWPESQEMIEEMFVGVPDDERRQMLGGNAIEYFHLDPTPPVQSKAPQAAVADAS